MAIGRFYWLIAGELAGCSRPGALGRGATPLETATEVERDLEWLSRRGIGAVLSLTETPLATIAAVEGGMEILHLPVPDLTAPRPAQFAQALTFIDRQRAGGRATAVHCLQGQGRTGSILAAYLIRRGTQPESAIDRLRTVCPGALSAREQEEALYSYAGRRDWIV